MIHTYLASAPGASIDDGTAKMLILFPHRSSKRIRFTPHGVQSEDGALTIQPSWCIAECMQRRPFSAGAVEGMLRSIKSGDKERMVAFQFTQ